MQAKRFETTTGVGKVPGSQEATRRDLQATEEALRDSEARVRELAAESEQQRRLYHTILSGTPDLVYVFGMDHRFVYANDALLKMWGKTWNEAIGKNCLELGYEAWHAAMHDREIEQVIATKKPIRGEVPFVGTGGRRIYDYIFVPVFGASGEVEAIAGTTRDITEPKQAELALRQSEALFRAVFNQQFQFMAVLSPEGRLLEINELPLAVGRVTRDEVIGKIFWETPWWNNLPGMRASWPRRLSEAAQKHGPVLTEDQYETADGCVRTAAAATTAVKNARGDVEFFIIQASDITERLAAEKALRASEERLREMAASLEQQVKQRTASLEEINRQMEVFTYTIAHDLRAPLRAQQGFASLLLEEYGAVLGETGGDYAKRIIASATRLNLLVQDLLAYSRIDRTEMKIERLDLQKIIFEVCDEMAFHIQEAKAAIQLGQLEFVISGHELTFRTAVMNLISNAIKFSRQGVLPEVKIWGEPREEWVRLCIEDNGIGIAAEHHHRIFGVFHRLHKSEDYPGTGVGLAIVQKGIERMGGRVGVKSNENKGSHFWVELKKAV